MSQKRTDYLDWNEYFMGIALLSAQRSKDPSTCVGSVIVKDTKIIGTGYNGFPRGCSDDVLPWSRESETSDGLDTKYLYVVHAEANAIMNSAQNMSSATVYTTLFPCAECAKLIIQAGISKVVYLEDKYHDLPPWIAARKMFDLASVNYSQFKPTRNSITLNYIDQPNEKTEISPGNFIE